MRIGLGESTRFLRSQHGWARRLLTRSFKPDDLVRELASTVADPRANVAGFHFYTFNEVQRMERWRRRTLDRLERLAIQSASRVSTS
jgi:methylenetetrahydrofolate reductase (NADPH)